MARRKRSRRGTQSRSLLTGLFGVGVALAPLVGYQGSNPADTPLARLQSGNWSGALQMYSYNILNNWAAYLFAILIVVAVAVVTKKLGARARISRHLTI